MNDNLQHMILPIQKIPAGAIPTEREAQAEYIACMERGIKFSAHGKSWGYFDGNMIRVVYFPEQIVQDFHAPSECWTDFLRRVA